ncbi:MAG: hypothetical protein ACHQQS_09300 [Thermoanaerobaculales bacterium]
MKRNLIVRTSVLAAVVAALLITSLPAEAGWRGDVGFSATLVAPPVVVTVGNRPFFRPWHHPYWRPYCGPVAVPYAAPFVVTPPLARVFVRFPYPHWVPRPFEARRYWHRGY